MPGIERTKLSVHFRLNERFQYLRSNIWISGLRLGNGTADPPLRLIVSSVPIGRARPPTV